MLDKLNAFGQDIIEIIKMESDMNLKFSREDF